MQQTINKWFVTCLETIIPLTSLSPSASEPPLVLVSVERLQVPKLGLEKEQIDIIRRIRKEIIRLSQVKLWFINKGFD